MARKNSVLRAYERSQKLEDCTTEDLKEIIDKHMLQVEDQISKSTNLRGTTIKDLREALAKINVAFSVLGQRVQASPGEAALEELRLELEAIKRENSALREGLQKKRKEITHLRTQSAAALIDSPKRTFKGDKER